jgi:hypothetical protein
MRSHKSRARKSLTGHKYSVGKKIEHRSAALFLSGAERKEGL